MDLQQQQKDRSPGRRQPQPRSQVMASLMDEILEEIFLRLPPDDPGSLLSAALVCKAWCRVVSDPGFNPRFREFHHGTSPPPVLGFFCSLYKDSADSVSDEGIRFVPTTSSFRRLPHAFMPNWFVVDARHGRILFYDDDTFESGRLLHLIVWNPITGEASRLPVAPLLTRVSTWNAALLCDHAVDSFRVVLVANRLRTHASACVYSSDQHVWSAPISAYHPQACIMIGHNALVGNAVYFKFHRNWILEFDMSKQELSFITVPPEIKFNLRIGVMTAEGGELGFAVVLDSKLYTWSREAGPDGAARWPQRRVFELDNLLSIPAFPVRKTVVLAAGNDFRDIFIGTIDGLFVIHLKFGRVTKIYEPSDGCSIFGIVPYASFCTPVVGSGLYSR